MTYEKYIPAGTCPACSRNGFSERDASTKDAKGRHVYRAYRSCDCGEAWEVRIDPQTGRERIVQQGSRKRR